MDPAKVYDDGIWPLDKTNNVEGMNLIAQLVEIQKHHLNNDKSFQWYRDTKYLATKDLVDSRNGKRQESDCKRSNSKNLNLRKQSDGTRGIQSMLSVSYSWEENRGGASDTFTYRVYEEGRRRWKQSEVRDSIANRVLKYVRHSALPGFWVDKHCINQHDGPEKNIAIQSMDLVYRFGHRSIAFLTVAIHQTYQANLLSRLMSGKWIVNQKPAGRFKLRRYVRFYQATKMIALLEYILSDRWWTRAWTYHEEFCASIKMDLTMPCHENVNRNQIFDFKDTPGEICLPAVIFREQLTRFCLAYTRKQGERWQKGKQVCERLLTVAGQHKTINEYRKQNEIGHKTTALTWHIVRDLYHRGLNDRWEILGIIANCCGYSYRLDSQALKEEKYNLDAAVLTLILLNGEILRNDDTPYATQETSFFDLTDRLRFQDFDSTVDTKEYTYLKRCRFRNVELCPHGIRTMGCIWYLKSRFVVPATENFKPVIIDFQDTRLDAHEVEQLNALRKCIEGTYRDLAAQIGDFVDRAQEESLDPYEQVMVVMAKNIVRHIQRGHSIAIGSLLTSRKRYGAFAAPMTSSHCFTAWQPREYSDKLKADRYLEKVVSLEVDLGEITKDVPLMTIRKWVAGLHFADRTDQKEALMPWAASFQSTRIPC